MGYRIGYGRCYLIVYRLLQEIERMDTLG